LQRLRQYKSQLPHVLLIGDQNSEWLTPEGMPKVLDFGNGLGPAIEILERQPDTVRRAHSLGLSVTPYTFRSASTGRFTSVHDEMKYFLLQLDVDAVFTDNPDLFPRK
jgi:glycerophosphoryl diester phosphodiesterase